MSTFVDFVVTFKTRRDPISYAIFRHENYLEPHSPKFSLTARERSGVQIQHAFNLLSVERSRNEVELNAWPLRQIALYHSFDVISGQTLFIVLKGNREMKTRIVEEIRTHQALQPSLLTDPVHSFKASLLVQLMALEWCAENWGEYIDVFEEKVKDKSAQAKIIPVAEFTTPVSLEQSFSRRATMSPMGSRQNTFARRSTLDTTVESPTSLNESQQASPLRRTNTSEIPSSPTSPTSPQPPLTPARRTSTLRQAVTSMFARVSSMNLKDRPNQDLELAPRQSEESNVFANDLEQNLSFEEFQTLNMWSDDLEQSLMAIEQNQGVLAEIKAQYEGVIKSGGFSDMAQDASVVASVDRFFERIGSIVRDLRIHDHRLRVISRNLESDKVLVSFTPDSSINLVDLFYFSKNGNLY
jgi:hypothetical protein